MWHKIPRVSKAIFRPFFILAMQSFALPMQRVYELVTVVDSIPLKDLGTIKDIRLTTNLIKDLRDTCTEFATKNEDLAVKQAEIAKKYQEEYAEKRDSGEVSEAELKVLAREMDEKLNAEIKEKLGTETEVLQSEGEAEVKVDLSDEKHSKLKELFSKYAAEKYLSKKVFIQVADALGAE